MRTLGAIIASALLVVATYTARGRILGEVATTASAAPGLVSPADPLAVASVRIKGKNLPIAALERALSTRTGHRLSDDDLARDRTAILATLEARGHLGATVTGVRVAWANGAHVVFDVDSAGVYQVDDVKVSGAPTAHVAELAIVPTLLRGQPWHPERAADNVSLLREWLAHRGMRADVTAHRTVDHVSHSVDVVFEIEPELKPAKLVAARRHR
ncbi:MAG TPA: POTRA domain-containing protein [Kofleriaceae bacterium]|nr:POTRA domain-containing protein [Kofleriaceae bacterium]